MSSYNYLSVFPRYNKVETWLGTDFVTNLAGAYKLQPTVIIFAFWNTFINMFFLQSQAFFYWWNQPSNDNSYQPVAICTIILIRVTDIDWNIPQAPPFLAKFSDT